MQLARDGAGVYVTIDTTDPGVSTAVVPAALSGKAMARQELPGVDGFWEQAGISSDGVVFTHRPHAADMSKTTLVTVSAAGSRPGLVIAGSGGGQAGAPIVSPAERRRALAVNPYVD